MKLRHYLALGAAVLILIGSFFLPNAVAGITDMRRLDNLVLVDSQRISFDTAQELTLPERLALAASTDTEVLLLSTGNVLNDKTAPERAEEEVRRFFNEGNFELKYNDLTVSEGAASLIIDIFAPTRYMIVWEFEIVDSNDNSILVVIDDETGVIVRMIYRMGRRESMLIDAGTYISSDGLFSMAAEHLVDLMTQYYGRRVTLADYQFFGSISYYRADITQAGITTPMYGVILSASFSMNERV